MDGSMKKKLTRKVDLTRENDAVGVEIRPDNIFGLIIQSKYNSK